jgi:hypothetical protein
MYTTTWFITAFMGIPLPLDVRLRIFDRFVVCGCRALLSFGLVIIARMQDILMKGGVTEGLILLQHLERVEQLKVSRVVMTTYDRVWISERDYTKFFKKAGLKYFK